MTKVKYINHGIIGDENSEVTACIQHVIDELDEGDTLVIRKGVYLTGALFLKSHMKLHLEEGAVLLGVQKEAAYPLRSSRVAGIEMEWPAGVLNILHATDVTIEGKGIIDGQGEVWWKKYWGEDKHSGMRKIYEEQGLRWAVDYDCTRVRNVIVFDSNNIVIQGIHSVRSGFWNIHLCYSRNVLVENVTISENYGPSTDGIDVDSCEHVLIKGCDIDCNDDNICIKSGRDADGLRVNRICEDVEIRNCMIRKGEGITLGSETSGGMRNIRILDNTFEGTTAGFRLKSALTRGGTLQNVLVDGMKMLNVRTPFNFQFNWYPTYSYCKIPEGYRGAIGSNWAKLCGEVTKEDGLPHARDFVIRNVNSEYERVNEYSEAFNIQGILESPFENFHFEHIRIKASSLGKIQGIKDFTWSDVNLMIGSKLEE